MFTTIFCSPKKQTKQFHVSTDRVKYDTICGEQTSERSVSTAVPCMEHNEICSSPSTSIGNMCEAEDKLYDRVFQTGAENIKSQHRKSYAEQIVTKDEMSQTSSKQDNEVMVNFYNQTTDKSLDVGTKGLVNEFNMMAADHHLNSQDEERKCF